MPEYVNQSHWMSLPMDTRVKIAEIFSIKKTGNTHVVDQKVVQDGFSGEDLLKITKSGLQIHLNSQEDDFYKLFNVLIKKIEDDKKMHEQEKSGEESISEQNPEAGTEIQGTDNGGDKGTTERVENAEQSEEGDLPDAPEELSIDSGREEVSGVRDSADPISTADDSDEVIG